MAALGELATKLGALPSAATARALFPRQIPALVANPDKTAVVVRALPALSIGIVIPALHKYPCEGVISGVVTEKSSGSALPAPGARVHLYVTDGMQRVARAVANHTRNIWDVAAQRGDDLEEIFEGNARAIELAKEYGLDLHIFDSEEERQNGTDAGTAGQDQD